MGDITECPTKVSSFTSLTSVKTRSRCRVERAFNLAKVGSIHDIQSMLWLRSNGTMCIHAFQQNISDLLLSLVSYLRMAKRNFIYCWVPNFNRHHQTCPTTMVHRIGHSRATQISNPLASQSPPVCEDIPLQSQKVQTDQLSTFTPQEMGIWPMNRTQNGPES